MASIRTQALSLRDEGKKYEKDRTGRKCWICPWLANRKQFGSYGSIFQEMKKDEKKFNEFLPVDEGQFKCLVEKSF